MTLPTPAPDSLETNVIVSRDGRSALRVVYYENHHGLSASESRDVVAMYFTVLLVPKEDESRLLVVFSGHFWRRFEPSWVDLDDVEREDAIMQLALVAIGDDLDVHGMPPHTPSGSPASVEANDAALDKGRKPATDQEVFDYLDGPVVRVGGRDVPAPYNGALEAATIPSADRVLSSIEKHFRL